MILSGWCGPKNLHDWPLLRWVGVVILVGKARVARVACLACHGFVAGSGAGAIWVVEASRN